MSLLLLLKQMCSDIEQLICKFWWRNSVNKDRGITGCPEFMSTKKSNGDLGFRKIHDFNLGLLGR